MKLFNLLLNAERFCKQTFKHSVTMQTTLETLKFDNKAIKRLPIDPEVRNYVRTVNASCFSTKVKPTPVLNPKLVACSTSAMELLDLSTEESERREFAEYFSGNKLLPGSEPASHCYCGHQFGFFSGQLGDGAAIYLGEVINHKNERWEIQLKGAGLTPYSRTADGRKVLRSSIREFLCSEAIHFLGIPSTRAGTCITSDSTVVRDIFYDGHPIEEKCSLVLRIAPTFIRFGSFEIFKTLDPHTGRVGPSVGRVEILHTMLQYVIETFFPQIHQSSDDWVEKYALFFKEVVLRTARLVAQWQCVGFCHGVLNTDNMSILGLTLDYGPYGFLDIYNPDHICNASDDGGRYSFIKQPEICLWNLLKFSEAIQQALPMAVSKPFLDLYEEEFKTAYKKKMQAKLGLIATDDVEDENFVQELFNTMEETGADFTNTFLSLLHIVPENAKSFENSLEVTEEKLLENCYPTEILVNAYKPNLNPVQLQTFKAIANSNPELLEQLGRAGLAVKRVLSQLKKAEVLENLTEEDRLLNNKLKWRKWLHRYKTRIGKDLKAYQGDSESYSKERLSVMRKNNPRFILRNYIAEKAIKEAENGNFKEVQRVLEALQNPYEHSYSDIDTSQELQEASAFTSNTTCSTYDRPPTSAFAIKVT